MKFATKTPKSADGQAALALVASLIQWLEQSGQLIDKDKREIVARAQKLAPQQPNERDEEAQRLIASIVSG
jgi:hypothetical protein